MDRGLARLERLSRVDSENKYAQKRIKALKERSNQQEEYYIVMNRGEYLYPTFFKGPKTNWLNYTRSFVGTIAKEMVQNYKKDGKNRPSLWSIKESLLDLIKREGRYKECSIGNYMSLMKKNKISAIKVSSIQLSSNYKSKMYWENKDNIYFISKYLTKDSLQLLIIPHKSKWKYNQTQKYYFDQYSEFEYIRNSGYLRNACNYFFGIYKSVIVPK